MKGHQEENTVIHSVIWFADMGFLICLPLITVAYSVYNHDFRAFIPLFIIEIVVGLIGYFISQTRKVIVDRNKQVITINSGLGNSIELPFGSITSIKKGKEYIILNFDPKNSGSFRLNYNFYIADDQKKILSLIVELNPNVNLVS